MKDPLKILLEPNDLFLEGVKHYNIKVKEMDKLKQLTDIYDLVVSSQAMVFVKYLEKDFLIIPSIIILILCSNKRKVEWLSEQLKKQDFTVSSHHGDLDMDLRANIINEFR